MVQKTDLGTRTHMSGNATYQELTTGISPAIDGIIVRDAMNQSDHSNHRVSAYSVYKALTTFAALFGIIKSGVSPTEFDPKAWYDRAIRVVGGLIILLVLVAGIVLVFIDHFKR
jgi:hypothetical protein